MSSMLLQTQGVDQILVRFRTQLSMWLNEFTMLTEMVDILVARKLDGNVTPAGPWPRTAFMASGVVWEIMSAGDLCTGMGGGVTMN